MIINLRYFIIDAKVDPRGKWAMIFLGIAVLFMFVDVVTTSYWKLGMLTPMDVSFAFLGASTVKCFEYVKLRENEIQRDKELKKRHEENKCPHCGESFTFTQDWNIHIIECAYNPKNRKDLST